MDNDQFEALQRRRECYHDLRLLPGAWAIVRVDGRSFTRFTETRFDKPFDELFSRHMVTAAEALVSELNGRYAYTESDEISVLLPPHWDLFDRSLEKLVSLSAGITSAAFTAACGEAAHFDSRVWLGTSEDDVADYFSWRQADAARCALNGWCYWTLRKDGASPGEATGRLDGRSVADKNELLFQHGINFNDVPLWQRRGIGIWPEAYSKEGFNPIANQPVTVERRRLRIDRELPMKERYRSLIVARTESTAPARAHTPL